MNDCKLTIAIPTYNRVGLLSKTLELILPQVTEDVEVLVCNNCSTDSTAEYVDGLGGRVRQFIQQANVVEGNFVSCFEQARGRHVWMLCDDDLPCSNAVACILEAIDKFPASPLIYLRGKSSDKEVSDYNDLPVVTEWTAKDPNGFLSDIGPWITFGSSIVARRESVNLEYVRPHINTGMTPAAIVLSTLSKNMQVMISNQPLLFVRGGNAGGYDAYTVFSKNYLTLLRKCAHAGFDRASIRKAYSKMLSDVVMYLIAVWPISAKGLFNLTRYSWTYKVFYARVAPALLRKGIRAPFRKAKKTLSRTRNSSLAHAYERRIRWLDNGANASFRHNVTRLGSGSMVRHPFHLMNPECIKIGANFSAHAGLRIEAWKEYQGAPHSPEIIIGDNVCVSCNVHVGAIGRLEIGNNVLIGSHVLITDHSHGGVTPNELELIAIRRPLVSKGPTIIEDNVWIGEGACILGGVRIGRNAVIGANAVVTSDVGSGEVVGGIPARVLKNRAPSVGVNTEIFEEVATLKPAGRT